MTLLGDKARPGFEIRRVAALSHEVLVHKAFGDDDMRHRGQHGHIGSRPQRQMMVGLDMGASDEIDAAWDR